MTSLFLFPHFPLLPPKLPSLPSFHAPHSTLSFQNTLHFYSSLTTSRHRRTFLVRADDGDDYDYDMDEGYDEEVEEIDNEVDYDINYDPLMNIGVAMENLAKSGGGGEEDGEVGDNSESKSFVETQGWDSEMVVDYKIDEDEFHKIRLLDCDFFIRKGGCKDREDDDDVYDFREMYVTPPDTDIYSIPRVLAPMPQKKTRCAQSEYVAYNVTQPLIDAPRDPLYKSEKEIMKVFLTKHYKNRRYEDSDFVLDFEEIYVIDSKTKSITRAKVLVTVPDGKDRDRKSDVLIIRDSGNSFKIIEKSQRDDPTTVIGKEEWNSTRQDMERHLRKLRDFNVSNWF